MSDALVHLGFDGWGLSPASVTRMTDARQDPHDAWGKRGLTGRRYVYLWADGICFGCRPTDDRPCLLVVMADGPREREKNWTELLLGLRDRGLTDAGGMATFEPKEAATYLVVAHRIEPDEKGAGYDSTKYSATVTMIVPAICPCCGE